jgi:hypothetical protein
MACSHRRCADRRGDIGHHGRQSTAEIRRGRRALDACVDEAVGRIGKARCDQLVNLRLALGFRLALDHEKLAIAVTRRRQLKSPQARVDAPLFFSYT